MLLRLKIDQQNMDCYKLNEETYKKIENFLESQKDEEQILESSYYKSLYSPATLINDWCERRLLEQPQEQSLEPILSENNDEFRKPCVTLYPDRRDCFNKVFEDYGYGQELLLDHQGFAYYGNYVTSYDLCYNHLTKGICGSFPRTYQKGKYKPSTDLSLIYGNLTQWGLKEKIYEKMKHHTCPEKTPVSESAAEYVHHNLYLVKQLNDFPTFKKVKAIY